MVLDPLSVGTKFQSLTQPHLLKMITLLLVQDLSSPVKSPVDDWLCRKFEKLNVTVQEGYPSRASETASLNRDQFIKPPKTLRWYDDMFSDKKEFLSAHLD